MRDWEATFSAWTERPSEAEQARYEWTLAEVRSALDNPGMAKYTFDLYAKGSYPNFTNVVRDSDVDVAVELTDMFDFVFEHRADGMTPLEAGFQLYEGSLSLWQFKDDIHSALSRRFGDAVSRGSKALHIRESERGLAADVVPCQTHRLYHSRFPVGYELGIRLLDDRHPAGRILNFPRQHLTEGTRKNDACMRRYKRVVRILKRLENEMVQNGLIDPVPSFLIESAAWNVPNHFFLFEPTWARRVRQILLCVYRGCIDESAESSDSWLEANAIKYLFHANQSWTRNDITTLCDGAWDYVGFS